MPAKYHATAHFGRDSESCAETENSESNDGKVVIRLE
jgi:hypothetical protein